MTAENMKHITMEQMIDAGDFSCTCGKTHSSGIDKAIVEPGAINRIPAILRELGVSRPFLLAGQATFAAAGECVCRVLEETGLSYSQYVFSKSPVKPTEEFVGSAVMHFDDTCDVVIGIGSGVVNDIGKILARVSGLPYLIVATAPSMDGYASATSSMEVDGFKISLPGRPAGIILGDLDILSRAPMHLLHAGVGDMVAKYISLCEWRIANVILGEYCCPVVVAMVENALESVVREAPALLRREPEAVRAVMEGMIISGAAMNYAGLSRPASGMEHYFSHIWDMRSLAMPEVSCDLHGIQCGIGALYSLRVYDYLRTVTPNRAKALAFAQAFDLDGWNEKLRAFIGPAAESMIHGEELAHKYDLQAHASRLERIISCWDELQSIIASLPTEAQLRDLLLSLGAPISAESFGYSPEQIRTTFTMTKDVRDKYIASRLLWDLGLLDEAAEKLF